MNRPIRIASLAGLLTVLTLTEAAPAQFFWRGGRGTFITTPFFSYSRGYYPGWYGYGGYSGWGWGDRVYYSRRMPGRYYYDSAYYRPYSSGYLASPYYTYASSAMPDTGTYQSFYAGPGRTGSEALVRINVPNPEANVWFDDALTQHKGWDRLYISPPLETGKSYTYHIRASWVGPDGQQVTRERQVEVRPGQQTNVTFTAPQTDRDRDMDRGTGTEQRDTPAVPARPDTTTQDRDTDRGAGTPPRSSAVPPEE
jgi:uncharacterized protein (TIGR03000 family)